MIRRILYVLLVLLMFGKGLQAQVWHQYLDSGNVYLQQKNIDTALKYFYLSGDFISKDSVGSDSHVQILTNIADILYTGKSQYSKADSFYLEARLIIAKHKGVENDSYAGNANLLGQVNYFLKYYDKSENYYLEAKMIWERIHGKNSWQYAGICNALGILYNEDGQFEKAESQHLEARAIREKLFTKAHGAYAQSCNNLAAIYWNLGQYHKAEPLALEAKEIRGNVAGIKKSVYAISCVNLANIYRDMGKYSQAEALYLEAKSVREDFFTKEHDDYALSCDILADLYYFMKQYVKAEELYLEAKGIRQKISSTKNYFYAQGCSNLAALYRVIGKYPQAESFAMEAGAILDSIGSAVIADIAINNNTLGSIYYSMSDLVKAEKYFLLARGVWQKRLGEMHPFFIENSLSLARVYRAKRQVEKANEMYVQAFEAKNRQVHQIFSFTGEEEKQLYLKNIAGAEDEYQSFYFEQFNQGNKGQPYDISLLKRNQVLTSSRQLRQLIYSSGDSMLLKNYDLWISLKKQIAALYSKGDQAPKEHLNATIEKADLLEKELVRNSAVFKKANEKLISWQAIRKQLKPSEAAIEFIEFNYFDGIRITDSTFYAALILRRDMQEPLWVTLFEKRFLDSLLTITADGGPGINTFYSRGVKLKRQDNSISMKAFNAIWKPIEETLNGITTVYFAPAGLLHRIAFAALPVDSVKVLGDQYQLVQLFTTVEVVTKSADYLKHIDQIDLFGGIRYTAGSENTDTFSAEVKAAKRSGFDYLPGTEKEVEGIARSGREKNFSPIVWKGFAAIEKAVKQLNGYRSPKILHIATHGFFFDDPQISDSAGKQAPTVGGKVFQYSDNPLFRSGLLFAGANDAWNGKYKAEEEDDGILTAYEVANLFLPNTKLVVLSACETALGDIKGTEGVYGLQRAFKMAGVKNLVMSLWKVPDLETAEFMQLFYKNMFAGKAIDLSFYEAQKLMSMKYRKEPYKWAAWILVK